MDHEKEERRSNGGLSERQIDEIKDAILRSVYEEIGRSIVKKVLWIAGAMLAALYTFLSIKGYIK